MVRSFWQIHSLLQLQSWLLSYLWASFYQLAICSSENIRSIEYMYEIVTRPGLLISSVATLQFKMSKLPCFQNIHFFFKTGWMYLCIHWNEFHPAALYTCSEVCITFLLQLKCHFTCLDINLYNLTNSYGCFNKESLHIDDISTNSWKICFHHVWMLSILLNVSKLLWEPGSQSGCL